MPDTDDLSLARWELATLAGRLRCVEDERDAALRDRDRGYELVRQLRGSRAYRIGRTLTGLVRDPVRTSAVIARRAMRRPVPVTKRKARRQPVPARVYVAVGLSAADSHALVRTLRQRIVVDADHRPVVVTDQPALRGMRVPGVVLEYLPDPATWERHEPAAGWEALLSRRVAHLCRDYGAVAAVVVDPRDPPDLARLLAPVTGG
jgi:hypothetical protein